MTASVRKEGGNISSITHLAKYFDKISLAAGASNSTSSTISNRRSKPFPTILVENRLG